MRTGTRRDRYYSRITQAEIPDCVKVSVTNALPKVREPQLRTRVREPLPAETRKALLPLVRPALE